MRNMTPKQTHEDPLVFMKNDQEWTTSLDVADKFGRRHDNVLSAISNLKKDTPEDFSLLNFKERDYQDSRGKVQEMFEMTRDGFALLAMGFTGKTATAWKIKYIAAFNKMERIASDRGNLPRFRSHSQSVPQWRMIAP